MSGLLKTAIGDYKNAMRMFDYAITPEEIDIAISLMEAADITIRALKYIPYDVSDFEPISEVY